MLNGQNPVSNVFGYKEGVTSGDTNDYIFNCKPWTEARSDTTEQVSLKVQNSLNEEFSTSISGKCVYDLIREKSDEDVIDLSAFE